MVCIASRSTRTASFGIPRLCSATELTERATLSYQSAKLLPRTIIGWWRVLDSSQHMIFVMTAFTQLLPFLAKHSNGIRFSPRAEFIILRVYIS
jgi:hypothetical protein